MSSAILFIFLIFIIFFITMAHVEVSNLSKQEVAELACTYAALILHDDDQEITGKFDLTQVPKSANLSMLLT